MVEGMGMGQMRGDSLSSASSDMRSMVIDPCADQCIMILEMQMKGFTEETAISGKDGRSEMIKLSKFKNGQASLLRSVSGEVIMMSLMISEEPESLTIGPEGGKTGKDGFWR